jgi:tetratricopeptide (TPR) repeat protein
MEGSRYKLIFFILLCFSLNIRASEKSEIYSAYVTGNMTKWKNIIDRMDKVRNRDDKYLLELTNYQYGYIAWCIGNKNSDEARKYLELADKNLSILGKEPGNLSLVNSYKAAFYGYRIGLNRLLAPFLGPKSIECAKLAIKLDDENPLAFVQYGNIQFYMPQVFGGSKKEALEYYLKALKLMEADEEYLNDNWNYLSLLTVIAQSYSYLDDFQSSLSYLEKILEIEPAFAYVKDELYPGVLKKINK